MGAAAHPWQTWRWLRFLHSHPALKRFCKSTPSLISKIYRPYLARALACPERVDLLMQHYDFTLKSCLAATLQSAMERPLALCRFSGKSGTVYRLELTTGNCRNDGEWLIRLMSHDTCIYSVSFLFVFSGHRPDVMIGALKGRLALPGLPGIKQITIDLYGCRPGELMVVAVRAVGGYAGCRRTLLIGNRNKLRSREKRVCKKSSNYDRIWQELQAMRCPNDDFSLPCISPAQLAQARDDALCMAPGMTRSGRALLLDSVLLQVAERLALERSAMPCDAAISSAIQSKPDIPMPAPQAAGAVP